MSASGNITCETCVPGTYNSGPVSQQAGAATSKVSISAKSSAIQACKRCGDNMTSKRGAKTVDECCKQRQPKPARRLQSVALLPRLTPCPAAAACLPAQSARRAFTVLIVQNAQPAPSAPVDLAPTGKARRLFHVAAAALHHLAHSLPLTAAALPA